MNILLYARHCVCVCVCSFFSFSQSGYNLINWLRQTDVFVQSNSIAKNTIYMLHSPQMRLCFFSIVRVYIVFDYFCSQFFFRVHHRSAAVTPQLMLHRYFRDRDVEPIELNIM